LEVRVAAVQMTSTPDRDANLATATRLTAEALDQGATFVVLPETFDLLGGAQVLHDGAEPLETSAGVTWARDTARAHAVWIVAGSVTERVGDGRRHRNTSCLVSPTGEVVATYSKLHLFDVTVGGVEYRESDTVEPGDEIVVADAGPLRVGMSLCYDLRFPELARIETLRGATVLVVPSAFTATTGPPHWEPLLRARAIENQVFVIAANQVGHSTARLAWHGHSMAIDPWGRILGCVPDHEGVLVVDLDLDEIERVRATIPSLRHRRPDVYRWPEAPLP